VRAEVRTVRIFNSTKTKQKIKKQTNRKNRKWKKKKGFVNSTVCWTIERYYLDIGNR
jgi:hypothetical protein